jgi:hypothetical protein
MDMDQNNYNGTLQLSCFLEKQCAKILSSTVNPYLQKLTVLDVDKERFHEYCH